MGPTTRLLGCRSPIMKSNSLAGHVSGPVRTPTRLDFAQLATRRCAIKIKPVAALGEVPRRIRKTRVRIPPPPRVLKVHLLWRREHCWRCTMHPTPSERVLVVSLKDRTSPFDRVAYSDTRRLRPRPEFEVLRTIIVTNSIAMMNRFTRFEVSTQHFFCNKNVFEHVRIRTNPRVIRHSNHHVSRLVQRSATLPIPIRRGCDGPTRRARRRLRLPRIAAHAHMFRPTCRATTMPT